SWDNPSHYAGTWAAAATISECVIRPVDGNCSESLCRRAGIVVDFFGSAPHRISRRDASLVLQLDTGLVFDRKGPAHVDEPAEGAAALLVRDREAGRPPAGAEAVQASGREHRPVPR